MKLYYQDIEVIPTDYVLNKYGKFVEIATVDGEKTLQDGHELKYMVEAMVVKADDLIVM